MEVRGLVSDVKTGSAARPADLAYPGHTDIRTYGVKDFTTWLALVLGAIVCDVTWKSKKKMMAE